ncbi:putative membrane protein YccC [Paraburkholderia sp. GAS199]|uniref:FUSC family protein n=1 Tax=Paraburkholderia sp. GAS199 TaxID=3035126 RepID=UPI003D23AE3B
METRAQTTPRSPVATAMLSAASNWMRTDGSTWLYLVKALIAAFLSLYVAMKLELPQPRTAMTTVFIVMQPQSGMVFAKSFYRICGTVVGLLAMLALIGLFAQQPELFILSTAIWVGICTAGAARYRNFRSYGFVLAGYTAALIGFPASQNPDGAFLSALTRVAEVVVGIICSGAVSGLIFPQYTGEQIRTTVRARYSAFVEYVSSSLEGEVDRAGIEATNASFVADIVGFEAARSVAVFESAFSRLRSRRLSRLNSEFMTTSTRFRALHQLMNRLYAERAVEVIKALEPYYREIGPLLKKSGEPILTAADARVAAAQLEDFKRKLPGRFRATRSTLENQPNLPLLDFDTASELLYRFVDDLHAYSATYASLAVDTHERERWIERYEPKTNAIFAAVSGLRATGLVIVLGAFWIETAWPSGPTLLAVGATTSALASTFPNPTRMAIQMAIGAGLSALAGLFVTFGIYPRIDGFPLLCAALTPFLLFGVFMTTRPKLVGYGVGYCIFFCFLSGPDNVIQYNPSGLINDAIALTVTTLVGAIAFAVFLPPSTRWMRNRLMGELRRQAVVACHGRLRGLRSRFESGTRDLMFQASTTPDNNPQFKRDALLWMFSVLEVGGAVVDLREEIARLSRHARHGNAVAWRVAERRMRETLATLFGRPSNQNMHDALVATNSTVGMLVNVLADPVDHDQEPRLRRILSHLHFIRSALLDPQSPLDKYRVSQNKAK